MSPFELATAGRIVFGAGTVRRVGELARELGHRALLVTGATASRAAPIREALADGVVAELAISAEPSTEDARRGVAIATEAEADFVIAMGGGSALDAGKAVAALLANGGDPLDYLEVVGAGRAVTQRSLPLIAIPTTAGTGSEVTRNAVLESPEHRVKVSLRSHLMLPSVALVDPELTFDLPPSVTASTGFDALSQVIEPFVCNRTSPVVDALCRDAIARGGGALGRAFADGRDARAREDMAFVSLCGGLALANARLGAVHGFAGPIGGMFGSPHGATCAALLPHVLEWNLRALARREPSSPLLARFDELGRLLTGSSHARAADAVRFVADLSSALAIPKLSAHGVRPADFPAIVEKAARSSSMQGNPLVLEREELVAILEAAT